MVWYCSKDCQVKHWNEGEGGHKHTCKMLRSVRKDKNDSALPPIAASFEEIYSHETGDYNPAYLNGIQFRFMAHQQKGTLLAEQGKYREAELEFKKILDIFSSTATRLGIDSQQQRLMCSCKQLHESWQLHCLADRKGLVQR